MTEAGGPILLARNTAQGAGWRHCVGHPGLALACRVALGAIFIYAGLPKALAPQVFLMAVRGYRILPDIAIPTFTLILPMVEVLAGACLLMGIWLRPSAAVIGAMIVLFLAAIISALARGIDIECGCFAGAESKVGASLILRDLGMLALLIPIFAAKRQWLAMESKKQRLFCFLP